ncbi:hypothetical protein SAMN05444266_103347 [Chitinophaga jiangningensis]|uniref:Uncharacterized protein n=1 Tax=Chitinophaga jiangningensis TaxID=1419482 RepID=A0A1M7AMM9_9BACT|nr:hypothetical protein [Chitinophaga jiangningensis]SHL44052.1 hypothetical protein SAMN05444266_103347 [Chitinophaga jiangningensis]
MKKFVIISGLILFFAGMISSCKKNDLPVDEDGLLITTRTDCYVSNFELLGSDFQTVRSKAPVIDTAAGTITQEVFYGADLKNLWPQLTLAQDCKLEPKITGKTDFSDLANPRQYTVVSGNRQVRKTYKIIITVQPK